MRISDWSSDVCSSDLATVARLARAVIARLGHDLGRGAVVVEIDDNGILILAAILERLDDAADALVHDLDHRGVGGHLADLDRALFGGQRSEERRVGKECVRTCRSRWSPYY